MAALHKQSFTTLTEAETAVYGLAEASGFAIVIKRSKKKKPDEDTHKFDLECSKGKSAKSKGTGKRRTPIGRDDCQWSGYLSYLNCV